MTATPITSLVVSSELGAGRRGTDRLSRDSRTTAPARERRALRLLPRRLAPARRGVALPA